MTLVFCIRERHFCAPEQSLSGETIPGIYPVYCISVFLGEYSLLHVSNFVSIFLSPSFCLPSFVRLVRVTFEGLVTRDCVH